MHQSIPAAPSPSPYTKSFHFYMVFLGVVCKIWLKYSKELLDYKAKITKTYIINKYR